MTETNNKETRKNKRRWIWWVVAGVVLVAAFVGWRIWQNNQNATQTLSNLETEPYQRRTLNANIFGTGSVEPNQSAMLTWTASGIVGDINVQLGQAVKKDELLMALDPDSVTVDILQAQIEVINAQNALNDLYTNWGSDLAQTRLDLLKAEEALDDLSTERKIMNYQRCTDERIEDLEDQLDQAERIYKFKQSADTLSAVNTAQANLNFCQADYTEQEIAKAELKVKLEEARVANLQQQVDTITNGPDPDQVIILETQLDIAQSRLDSPMIKAPFDGIVTVLPVQPGDVVQVGMQAVQIDDLSKLYLDVQISEVDIPQVAIGQSAELIFDAFFESVYNGEVIKIAPVGNSVQGVVEYTVRVALRDGDDRIKPGMTAAVNIVVDVKEDALVVPNSAIVVIDGQEQVFVRRNGGFKGVPITLGSYSDFYSEVVEADIKEGELIILNPPNTVTGEQPFGGRPSGGMGPFGN